MKKEKSTAQGFEIDSDKLNEFVASIVSCEPLTIERSHWRYHSSSLEHELKGETIIAQMRCPKCNEWFTITDQDIDSSGVVRRKNKKHPCGYSRMYFKLKDFKP